MTALYKVVNGTNYRLGTPDRVVDWLETLRQRRQLCRLFCGDTKTGVAWLEEHDSWGYIGRSMGPYGVPLMLHPLAHAGPEIMSDRIVGILTNDSAGKAGFVYRHPKLTLGEWTHEMRDGEHVVLRDGAVYARVSTENKAKRLADFMGGRRVGR